MNFFALSGLINGIISTGLGIFVFTRNRKDARYVTHSLFCLTVSIWSYFYFAWQIAQDGATALFYCRSFMAGAIFIPVTYLHHLFTFFGIYPQKKKLIFYGYLSGFLFLLLDFTPFYISDVSQKLYFKFWPTPGIAFHPFLILWVLYVLGGIIIIISEYKKSIGLRRNQFRYVLLATFVGWSGGATNYLLWYNIPVPPFGNILVSGYMIIVTYAILKYRLMDINVALTRAGIFIVVYALVLGLPFWLGYRYQLWEYSTWIMLTLATLGPFIYTYLRRQAEKRLRAEEHRYQKTLLDLAKTMTRIRDLDQLLKAIVLTVVDAVHVPFAAVYLKDEEYKSYRLRHCFPKKEEARFQELISLDNSLIKLLYQQKKPLVCEGAAYQDKVKLDSGLVIPCFIERDELLGFLVLGVKPNNQIYTSDDLLVFETLSYSTSLAIENSTFWKEIEDRHRKARLQEMDTYSYSLAHEIDNPIQVIIGYLELFKKFFLQELNLAPEKRKEIEEMLSFMSEAAWRISGMVKAIRDFGQKTTGEFIPLNIEDVVDSFAKLYFPKFKDKSVFFEKTSTLRSPVFVLGEKPQLMQVLVILADNSVHALNGIKEKRVSLKIEAINNEWVRIYFTDNGYGIKKEIMGIIFEAFTTTKASSEGTGMGLHNAKKMVERHKGKIWAESAGENKGVTFIVELPIAKDINPNEQEKSKGKKLF